MGKPPAFQLYASDFYMDTSGWTATQIGIYFRLLMFEWVNGSIPNGIQGLARIAQIDPGNFLKCYRPTVEGKFFPNGNGELVNRRLEEVRENQRKYRESQSEKGKASAEKRWGDRVTGVITTVTERLQPKDNSSSSSSSSSLNPKSIYSDSFSSFWNKYPKKEGKSEATKIFEKIEPDEFLLKVMLAKITQFKRTPQWMQDGGRFIPKPATWLNERRWEDEITTQIEDNEYEVISPGKPRVQCMFCKEVYFVKDDHTCKEIGDERNLSTIHS